MASVATAVGRAVPESYPAAYVEQILDTLTDGAAVQAAYVRSESTWLATGIGDIAPHWIPRGCWRWYRVAAHPLLSEVLPGVVFYLAVRGREDLGWLGIGLDWDMLVAVRNGESYVMPWDLNQLLWDSGMKFKNSDAQAWARVGAVIWSWAYRSDVERPDVRESPVDSVLGSVPVFPAQTVEAESLGDTLSRNGRLRGTLTVRVSGRRVSLHVVCYGTLLRDTPSDSGRAGFVPWLFIAPEWNRRYIKLRTITTGR